MTADDKFSRHKSEKWCQPIQMESSEKLKLFSKVFAAFLKSALNFQHFQRKDEPHSLRISGIIDSERRVYLNVKRGCFSTPLDRQHVKGSQTLLNSAPQHFYRIVSSLLEKLSRKMFLLVISETYEVKCNHLKN